MDEIKERMTVNIRKKKKKSVYQSLFQQYFIFKGLLNFPEIFSIAVYIKKR